LVIIRKRETFSFLQASCHVVIRRGKNLLIVNDLGHVDEIGKLALQILADEELELFRREGGELFCQAVEDRGIVAPCLGKGIDDGKRFLYDLLGFLPAEFTCQRVPFIDFFDGVSEIDGRVYEKILGDADLSLVGIDNA